MTKPQNHLVEWVDDSIQLESIVNDWQKVPYLAIDTEFERRTTYFPILSVVQIFDGKKIYIIDALKVKCPEVLAKLLTDARVVKILHACKEDLEAINHSWGCKLNGIFDTQLAYAFLHGELSLGYGAIVESLCGITLDKEQTQSDWMSRPLSPKQLDYAANDVLHLPQVFKMLYEEIHDKVFYGFFIDEMSELCGQVDFRPDFEIDYRKAKEVSSLDESELGLFKYLYQWREELAINENKTRNHIIKDQALVRFAKSKPSSMGKLSSLKLLHPKALRLYGKTLLSLLDDYNSESVDHEPLKRIPDYRDVKNLKQVYNELMKAIEKIAKQNQLAPNLVYSKRVANKIAYTFLASEPMVSNWNGWRKELVQSEFNKILRSVTSN